MPTYKFSVHAQLAFVIFDFLVATWVIYFLLLDKGVASYRTQHPRYTKKYYAARFTKYYKSQLNIPDYVF